MTTAYFDANVFGDIARRDRVTEADVADLLVATTDGRDDPDSRIDYPVWSPDGK